LNDIGAPQLLAYSTAPYPPSAIDTPSDIHRYPAITRGQSG
jgi:hypothetical protein